jgi:hypothetical protein
MWMNHTLEDTCPSSRSPRCNAGIYRFITKKTLKKPNLGESQMKTVFSSYSDVVVMTRDSRVEKSAALRHRRAKRNCVNKFQAHSTQFDCFSLCNSKNSDSSIPKPVTKIMVLIWPPACCYS